jgi:hypothetical protein
MAELVWDIYSGKRYEAGLDRGVLYPSASLAVPWNGLISVSENIEDFNSETFYYDGVLRRRVISSGNFSATLEAITYPDEFMRFDGYSQSGDVGGVFYEAQPRESFNLSYRTMVEEEGSTSYKIHVLYNLTAEPSSNSRNTLTNDISPSIFSWTLKSTPIEIVGKYPLSHLIIDSRLTYPDTLSAIEDILYGTPSVAPRLLLPEDLAALTTVFVVDNGDGTATITGPDAHVYSIDADTYEIDALGIDLLSDIEFEISSS